MKKLIFILTLFLMSCTAKEKQEEKSDSALMAPIDTLGKDTSRINPVADSVTKSKIDSAQKNQ
ncbi:hypothetical protein [Pedobacter frigiditerrae]|uniref:hypothetical protein n=1 Tax=Pedobacter frigiditerrae TaxID=2530452 RepID=UPI00292F0760|nr:hypothetical protein [Pedobacter frigiditerrae]